MTLMNCFQRVERHGILRNIWSLTTEPSRNFAKKQTRAKKTMNKTISARQLRHLKEAVSDHTRIFCQTCIGASSDNPGFGVRSDSGEAFLELLLQLWVQVEVLGTSCHGYDDVWIWNLPMLSKQLVNYRRMSFVVNTDKLKNDLLE